MSRPRTCPIDASHPEQAIFRWKASRIAEKNDNNRSDRRGFGAGVLLRMTRIGKAGGLLHPGGYADPRD